MKIRKQINIKLSEITKEELKQKAKAKGFDNVSSYIRWLIRNDK